MRKPDIDHISPQTQFSMSLITSLGYDATLVREREDRMDDMFKIYLDGKHIPFYNKKEKKMKVHVKRREFFDFCKYRHKSLKRCKLQRKIEYIVD